jgi:hypothetical protein
MADLPSVTSVGTLFAANAFVAAKAVSANAIANPMSADLVIYVLSIFMPPYELVYKPFAS